MYVIHKGKYGGTKLSKLAPRVMYDNRMITLESSLNATADRNFTKTLKEKGRCYHMQPVPCEDSVRGE